MADTATTPRVMASTHEPVALAATQIRRQLRTQLAAWGVPSEAADDALLVVEELVANALSHARSPFDVVVRLADGALHVAVHDRSTRVPHIQPFDPHAVRGRGLQLVASLSRRWGCEPRVDGKTVWAELAA